MLRIENWKFNKNPLAGYVNINSLRNKIIVLREIIQYLNLDYFVLSETKINSSFPSAQFAIDKYEIKALTGRNCKGERLIEYVRKSIISGRLKEYETPYNEAICSEIAISKKKWLCISIYRPNHQNTLKS